MQGADPVWEEPRLFAAHRLARPPDSAAGADFRESPEWERRHAALIRGAGSLASGRVRTTSSAATGHSRCAPLAGDPDLAARRLRAHYRRIAGIILGVAGASDPWGPPGSA